MFILKPIWTGLTPINEIEDEDEDENEDEVKVENEDRCKD